MTDFEKFVEEVEKNRKYFWNEKYPKMNIEEKKKWWLESTHEGMRTQGEAPQLSVVCNYA